MKGLLLKDAYLIWKYCKVYLLLELLFVVLMFFGENILVLCIYPCLIAGIIAVPLIAYDERDRWDRFAETLPCTRAQMVSAKYLISLCANVGWAIVFSLVQCFRFALGFSAKIAMMSVGLQISFAFLVAAFTYPILFRFGAERGRIFLMFADMLLCVPVGAFVSQVFAGAETLFRYGAMFALPVSATLFALSWVLSVVIYRRREM